MTKRILSMVLVFILVCCNGIIALTANADTLATVFTFTASEVDENGIFSLTFHSPVAIRSTKVGLVYDSSKIMPINADGSSVSPNSDGSEITVDVIASNIDDIHNKVYPDYVKIELVSYDTPTPGNIFKIYFQTLPGVTIKTNPFQLADTTVDVKCYGGISCIGASSQITYRVNKGTATAQWYLSALTHMSDPEENQPVEVTTFKFTASEVDENGRFSLTFNSPVELFGVTLAIEYDNSKVVPINADGSSVTPDSAGTNFTIDKIPNDWVQSVQSAKAYSNYIIIITSGSSLEPENYAYGDLYRIHFQTLPGTSIQTNPFQLKNSALYHGGIHAFYSSSITYGIREGTAAAQWSIDALTVGNTTVPEVISAEASPNTLIVGNTTTFTVKTNIKAKKLLMYTETGAIADEWSDSSYYTDNGNERIWTIEREIYSAGKRFLTFKASDGENVNDLSTATVSIQVTSEGKTMQTTLTSQKNVNITIGENYTATWKTDITAQSYNLLIYYNGNLIRTIKNYHYLSYTLTPAMLSNQGEYAIEVIPYYPGHDAIGDTATITVSPSETSTAVIKNINSTPEVVCNVDNFECTVITNANTDKVVLEYELGNRTDLTLASSTATEKTWKISRKLNYIGKRKLTVRAFDSNGIETTPSFVNVDVIPENITWNLTYDEASGELTIDTSDEISSKLTGAYAKLVVYKNGTYTNLLDNSGELALINKGEATSRTWNVFTDLNLVSGETYEFAVSYLSTYAQGFDCSAILENIGTKTISDTEEELPEIYSIDIEIDNTNEISLMSSEDNGVNTTIGKAADFFINTSLNTAKVYMVDSNYADDTSRYIELSAVAVSEHSHMHYKTYQIYHNFTSLHAKRPMKFFAKDSNGNMSAIYTTKNELTVGFPSNAWRGEITTWDDTYLTISQDESIKGYNANNKYYLWVKDKASQKLIYYHNMSDGKMPLTKQSENGCISHTWHIENELNKLSAYTAYEYGISGKSTYCDNMNVSTVDYFIGEFTTGDMVASTMYRPKYVNSKEGLYVYRSPYHSSNNFAYDQNGNNIILNYAQQVMCDDIASYAEGLGEEWIKIKCENYVNGIKYDTAYVRKGFLSDKPLYQFIWPTLSTVNTITSQFGWRNNPITGEGEGHSGVDIAGTSCQNTPIFATASGTVIKRAFNLYYVNGKAKGYGHYIVIDHGNGYGSLYAHMIKQSPLAVGTRVNIGDEIGRIGTSGGSTGYHLHFEIRTGDMDNYFSKANEKHDPLQYIRTNGQNNYYTPVSAAAIKLMSIEPQLTYELICYNKYGETITTISVDSDNAATINIPYSTEYISFVALPNSISNSAIVSYNGTILKGTEIFEISKDVDNLIDIIYVENETNEQTTYTVNLTKEEAESGNSLTSLMIADNERESGGDIPCYNVDISDNMAITLPKSISEIGLALETDNPYASIRVFKNGYYWIDSDVILLDDTINKLTIIVENELGEEKEYTLTINKESEYESDKTLENLYVFAYDSAEKYIDAYTFDATAGAIIGLPENAESITVGAEVSSDFATVSYYLNGKQTNFNEALSLPDSFVLTVRVTAEDGTYKDYTYTYEKPTVPLTKTTFRNTATYHNFYVTFEEPIDNATIYAAIYDEDGKLLGLQTSPCNGDDYYIVNVPVNIDTKSAKIFVWANDVEPLGGVEILNME